MPTLPCCALGTILQKAQAKPKWREGVAWPGGGGQAKEFGPLTLSACRDRLKKAQIQKPMTLGKKKLHWCRKRQTMFKNLQLQGSGRGEGERTCRHSQEGAVRAGEDKQEVGHMLREVKKQCVPRIVCVILSLVIKPKLDAMWGTLV